MKYKCRWKKCELYTIQEYVSRGPFNAKLVNDFNPIWLILMKKKKFSFDFTKIKLLIKKFVGNIKVIYND